MSPIPARSWSATSALQCGSRLYTSNLESFPGLIFVQLGTLDHPELIAPRLEMFVMRRLDWQKPLDLPQFKGMPT